MDGYELDRAIESFILDCGRDSRVLDVSPHVTPLRAALRQRAGRLVVLPDLQAGTERGPRAADGLNPYPDQYFDLIFGRYALPPSQSPDALVAAFKRVLKSGGRLLVQVPVCPEGRPAGNGGEFQTAAAWQSAFERGRLWVDLAHGSTPTSAGREYIPRHGPGSEFGPEPGDGGPGLAKDRAFPSDHWYLTLSGLK